MALDWANDHFVRLYTRDTDEDLLLSWEARAVWHEMLRKCDQSGLIVTKRGVRGLAALIRVPAEVVERVLQELLEDGRIRSKPNVGFVVPNYVDAQFTPRSDRARKETSRIKRRTEALTDDNHTTADDDGSRDVTSGHAESHRGTHNITVQTQTQDISSAPAERDLPSPPAKKPRSAPKRQIPDDWQPRAEEAAIAAELGLDVEKEAREFATWWRGEGGTKANWDLTFRNRLYQVSERKRSNGRSAQTEIRHMERLA